MSEVNHILHPGQVYSSEQGVAAYRAAFVQEVSEPDGSVWLWYTMGADLAPKIDEYKSRGWTLGDPVITGLYKVGLPVNKREVVGRNKGPSPEQALADADGENNYPRFMAGQPVCYTRQAEGQEWLVYAKGPHMREALKTLWAGGRAVIKVEVICDDENGAPLLFNGKRVYRRRVVPNTHPAAVKPEDA